MGIAKKILSPKTSLLLIYIPLILYIAVRIIGGDVYTNTAIITRVLMYISFIWSFLYLPINWLFEKNQLKKRIKSIIIGILPALYFIILFFLSK